MTKPLQPDIRFKGFTDAWEQRKLGDISMYENSNISMKDINNSSEGYPVYDVSKIIGHVNYYHQDNKYISIIKDGAGVGRTNLRLPYTSVIGTMGYIKSDCIDIVFLFYSIKNINLLKYISGSTIPHIYFKDYSIEKIGIPDYSEQNKISKAFEKIDHTITLHQRQLDQLKELKRTLLQKMFPKKDEKIPEYRFPGFTDAWEQRELKNLVTRVKSYSLSRSVETDSDTNTKYVHYGDIHTHVVDKIVKETKLPNIVPGLYETLNKGDLVLADASEDYQGIASPAIVMVQTDYSLVAGLHTIALRPIKINSLYLYYLIKSPIFRKYGYKVGTGMKVFGISVNRLLDFKALMPLTVEQNKIAELLFLVDNLITLHQRKLELLQDLKKTLLQQLFV